MYTLPNLPYEYDELEPHFDAQTMEIHYSKHHQGYLNKLNAALEDHPDLFRRTAQDLLMNLEDLPAEIKTAVRNNGGGFVNHTLFWEGLSPSGGGEPKDEVAAAITKQFGSFNEFKEVFSESAKTQFGSGWAWLVMDGDGDLQVYSTPNQDSPLLEDETPLLGLDVWEHAYYLKYQNKRPDYVTAFWEVVNWEEVNKRYLEAKKS